MASIRGKEIGLVYTGKAGCMCGCRGKYSNKPAVISKVVNAMKKYPPGADGKTDCLTEQDGCCFAVNYTTPGGTERTLVAYYDRNE